jgi:hypothetical protein
MDRTDGEIDTLATRLAGVRTLAYIANRPDWLIDPAHWQGVTRGLEERLSDALHEKLMARFIDRRTSVLMRQLGDRAEMLAGVAEDGTVTVEGHVAWRSRPRRRRPLLKRRRCAAQPSGRWGRKSHGVWAGWLRRRTRRSV